MTTEATPSTVRQAAHEIVYVDGPYWLVFWLELAAGAIITALLPHNALVAWIPVAIILLATTHFIHNVVNDPWNRSETDE